MKTLRLLVTVFFLSVSLSLAAEPINLNTADAKTLTSLSGIGMAKAEAIIAYRTQHGPFGSVDQLTHVQGIGTRTLEQNRDRLTVGTKEIR